MPHLHDAAAAIAFRIVLDWYDGELGHPTAALTHDPVALQQAIAGAIRNVTSAASTAVAAHEQGPAAWPMNGAEPETGRGSRTARRQIVGIHLDEASHEWLILGVVVVLTLVLAILLGAAVALVFGPTAQP